MIPIHPIIKLENRQKLEAFFSGIEDWESANRLLLDISGIHDFFRTEAEFQEFKQFLEPAFSVQEKTDRSEYGDFQTPEPLTDQICRWLRSQNIEPTAIIEPTFGRGAFIISALKTFPTCQILTGLEIYDVYFWETKFKILDFFLEHPSAEKPSIFLYHADIFRFDLQPLVRLVKDRNILILGNPPWVTNAELSSLNSPNLPEKSNFKGYKGLDAITGKGNFDICESILLLMLKLFSRCNGYLAMLAKNSVIRNIVHDLPRTQYSISHLRALRIDSKKYFGAAVEASLFFCKLNSRKFRTDCVISDLEFPDREEKRFGWTDGKFVADIQVYQRNRKYDGRSPYEWRQGIKHDCSKVFELVRKNEAYVNGFGQRVEIEDDPIYGLVKSADLREMVITEPKRFVIVTQKRIGEDTAYIEPRFPQLYRYLTGYGELLQSRKSAIYKNNPPFSMFGIGEYSFAPFKVAVSGLYKQPRFALLLPYQGKPLMVDDTCYLLGFRDIASAVFVWALLNHPSIQQLLLAITFADAKRPFTKHVLMRLDIHRLAKDVAYSDIVDFVQQHSDSLLAQISEEKWSAFLASLTPPVQEPEQLNLF